MALYTYIFRRRSMNWGIDEHQIRATTLNIAWKKLRNWLNKGDDEKWSLNFVKENWRWVGKR